MVRDMSNRPMPDQGYRDTKTNSPKEPAPATCKKENCRQRKLLQHPRRFEELIEPIILYGMFEPKFWRIIQFKPAAQLPECVLQETGIVARMRRAECLALMPIAHVVSLHNAKWACHADKDAKIHQYMFDP